MLSGALASTAGAKAGASPAAAAPSTAVLERPAETATASPARIETPLAQVVTRVRRGDSLGQLLDAQGIALDGDALSLVYKLNPTLQSVSTLAPGKELTLPSVRGDQQFERYLKSGARFRVLRLYWQALSEGDRLDLVAEAVARAKDDEHHRQWKAAWFHWLREAASRDRAAERAVGAWLSGDRVALETALSELSYVLIPDDADDTRQPAPTAAGDRQSVSLALATAALVHGEAGLARLIAFYVEVADRHPARLPEILVAASAAVDFDSDDGRGW